VFGFYYILSVGKRITDDKERTTLTRVISQYIKKDNPNFQTIFGFCETARAVHNDLIYLCRNSKPSDDILYKHYLNGTLQIVVDQGLITPYDMKSIISKHEWLDKKKKEVEEKGEIWKEILPPKYKLFDHSPVKTYHVATRGKRIGEKIKDDFYSVMKEKMSVYPAPMAVMNQTLQQVKSIEISGWFANVKRFGGKHSKKEGFPKPPGYVNAYPAVVCSPSNGLRIEDGWAYISGKQGNDGFRLRIPFKERQNVKTPLIEPQELTIRFIEQGGVSRRKGLCEAIKIEFVYKKKQSIVPSLDYDKVLAIDPGYKVFATVVSNDASYFPQLLVGEHMKYYNIYLSEKIDVLRGIAKKVNDLTSTKQIRKIELDRKRIMEYEMHLYAKYIIKEAISHNYGTILIGHNVGQKQEINIGKKMNRKFYQIPFDFFRRKLKDLCEEFGLRYEETEESYTSQASFLDLDTIPVYEKERKGTYTFSGYFEKRGGNTTGYYISPTYGPVHRDVNGALNIIRKRFGDNSVGDVLNKMRNLGGSFSTPVELRVRDIRNALSNIQQIPAQMRDSNSANP
jgi:IS605 OrfB family transposase